MEVGAVKQAFNNEIILLKKNLNQAKIQIIHKLTRKAKTLAEKKAPEKLQEKLKRKAESAVNEVLIIKKIKPRDIARFIVTHTGQLNEYLNRPKVDNDKACARLLLHKALQEKYKNIRAKFSNVSIKDLFMSRQERLKLKKEAREEKKNKKKGKANAKVVSVEGEWDVEMTAKNNKEKKSAADSSETVGPSSDNDETMSDNEKVSGDENEEYNSDASDSEHSNDDENDDSDGEGEENMEEDSQDDSEESKQEKTKTKIISKNDKLNSSKPKENVIAQPKNNVSNPTNNSNINLLKNKPNRTDKKVKDSNKNKNLNEKLQKRKFNKDHDETPTQVTKIVDPFFVTSSGENYMSLAEPRQPDEVKEVHKQGNRQYRRAVMFGHVPKVKPKRNDFNPKNNGFDKHNSFGTNNNNRFNNTDNNFRRADKSRNNDNNNYKGKMDRQNVKEDTVPEKLHPSWEAKKKQSAILPFQGKKIVFDES